MKLPFRLILLWMVNTVTHALWAQPINDSCVQSVQRTRLNLDSMEVQLLTLTQTYQQIERLMAAFPASSSGLDQLPAVLPIEVPMESFRITSPFGLRRHPLQKQLRFHAGLDVRAPTGLLVKATGPGVVTQVGYDPVLGAFVRLQHAFGFETTYGHLSGYCVQVGQRMHRNQQLGKVGQTGRTTGPHLHYTLKKNGSIIDPFDFCFLLRNRLRLYRANSSSTSTKSDSLLGRSPSLKGSYPSERN